MGSSIVDSYDLQRFVEAQSDSIARAQAELRAGRKDTHWMWYVFPQIAGLGQSTTARKYAISSRDEARAYLNHPVLGARLLECTSLVIAVNGRSIEEIFGYPDYMKFHSSMTLFAHAAEDNRIFKDALKKYFGSKFDGQTVERL